MNKELFIRKIWDDAKPYIIYILSDTIKLLLTLGILKIILLTTDILFTEKPKIIQYVEIASYLGVLMIFIIDVCSNIYLHYKSRLKKIQKWSDFY